MEYTSQLKRAAGRSSERLELPDDATLAVACAAAAARHDEEFRRLLLTPAGGRQPTLLVFHCDRPVAAGADPPLSDGDTVTIMTPISGG